MGYSDDGGEGCLDNCDDWCFDDGDDGDDSGDGVDSDGGVVCDTEDACRRWCCVCEGGL